MTDSKSNEIPAGRPLLLQQDLAGKIVLADALHTQDETARQILHQQGGDFLLTVKGNQLTVQKPSKACLPNRPFPPRPTAQTRALRRERNRGRLEIRLLECLEVTPRQVGFPGARLAARLETRIRRQGKWCRGVVYLLSSLTLAELHAQGMLALKRGYWAIESRLHYCMDITLHEDHSRVRSPRAARVLGMIRRVVVSLANAAVDHARKHNPKTKCNTRSFQNRFRSARGGRQRLHALIFSKSPNILDL